MPVRIFISHSTPATGAHAKFRDALYDHLASEGFGVYLDQYVAAGRHWREVLFGELADCNAAVILVNQRVLHDSDWVDTEARILGWRAWVERKDFRLLIVPFDGVTPKDLENHKAWSTLALAELQMIGRGSLDIKNPRAVQRAFDAIVRSLRELDDADGQAGWLVAKLREHLPEDPARLETIAAKLKCALPRAAAGRVLRRVLAKHVYALGPRALQEFRDLPARTLPREDLRTLLELLRTYWVDPRASTSILQCTSRVAPRCTFAINSSLHYFTPAAYVDQVFPTRVTVPVLPIDSRYGVRDGLQQVRDALVEVFQDPYRTRFRLQQPAVRDIDAWANALLEMHFAERVPVFVALSPLDAANQELIDAIRTTYPRLGFILCVEEEGRAGAVEILQPPVDPDAEARGFREYTFMQGQIR